MDKIFLKDVNNLCYSDICTIPQVKADITRGRSWASQMRIFYILHTPANWKFAMVSSTADENGVCTADTDQILWQPINLSDFYLWSRLQCSLKSASSSNLPHTLYMFVSTGTFSMFLGTHQWVIIIIHRAFFSTEFPSMPAQRELLICWKASQAWGLSCLEVPVFFSEHAKHCPACDPYFILET